MIHGVSNLLSIICTPSNANFMSKLMPNAMVQERVRGRAMDYDGTMVVGQRKDTNLFSSHLYHIKSNITEMISNTLTT